MAMGHTSGLPALFGTFPSPLFQEMSAISSPLPGETGTLFEPPLLFSIVATDFFTSFKPAASLWAGSDHTRARAQGWPSNVIHMQHAACAGPVSCAAWHGSA